MGNTFTDGSVVTTGDLTTVAHVKNYLDISGSDDDTVLGQLVDRATKAIESYCKRTFSSASYTEYHDGKGASALILKHRPVTAVTSVHDDADRVFGADSLIASTDYIVREAEGIIEWLTSSSTFPSTAAYFYDYQLNVKVIYTAGYSTIPDDLEQACIMLAALLYHRGKQGADGIKQEAQSGAYSVTYVQGLMTPEIKELLMAYREYKM